MDRCYSSVLQPSFICHPQGVRAGQPKRKEEKPALPLNLAPLFMFFFFFSSPPEPALCKLGQPGGLFVLPEVLTLVLGPSFVPFSRAFPFFVL